MKLGGEGSVEESLNRREYNMEAVRIRWIG